MGKALVLGDHLGDETIGYMIEKANEVFRSETYSLFLMDSEKGHLSGSPTNRMPISRLCCLPGLSCRVLKDRDFGWISNHYVIRIEQEGCAHHRVVTIVERFLVYFVSSLHIPNLRCILHIRAPFR